MCSKSTEMPEKRMSPKNLFSREDIAAFIILPYVGPDPGKSWWIATVGFHN
jgi:hypothetical protein